MTRRVVQAVGACLAALSLASYWVATAAGEASGLARPSLVATAGSLPSFTIVLAGRDLEYCGYHTLCQGEARWGKRTDTIMVARVQPGRMDVISLPRDTVYTDANNVSHKINAAFAAGGAPALKSAVEQMLGVNVDYYAVVNIDFVERLISELGGVDVFLPQRMDYDDEAANLHIHFPAGNVHLDGPDAVRYLRFRHGAGSDYARMDRGKDVVGQILEKARRPRALAALPTLLAGLMHDVETNLDLASLEAMLPAARGLRPSFATLPTRAPTAGERWALSGLGDFLEPDREAMAAQLGDVLGTAPLEAPADALPTVPLTIFDASGTPRLGEALAALLEREGFPRPSVAVLPPDDAATRVLRRPSAPEVRGDAELYARHLNLSVFAPFPYLYPASGGLLSLHLGRDAAGRFPGLSDQAAALEKSQ